jgi:hypothetical protein
MMTYKAVHPIKTKTKRLKRLAERELETRHTEYREIIRDLRLSEKTK